jgi:hypothetical protein
MKLTRRQLAAAIAPAALVTAQQPAAPAPDLQTAARDRLKAQANALSGVPLPMSTEPAFQFKA